MSQFHEPVKQHSSRSVVKASPSVFLSERQKEAIDIDRRQLRRKVAAKLKDRDENEDLDLLLSSDCDDAMTIYEDLEELPWRQREAAIDAGVSDGVTESRMEGIESLMNTLQVYYSHNGYGRGPGFGWSSQNKRWISHQEKLSTMRHLLISTSTQQVGTMVEKLEKKKKAMEKMDLERQYEHEAHKQRRFRKMLSLLYILIGVASFLGFAYYVETMKINTFEAYLPNGISISKSVKMATTASETTTRRHAMSVKQEQQSGRSRGLRH
mmetsp:Transcript_10944/g.16125  ORF Transcript_10944/g.16125 Transcript_10944/m.16125 type:complete len:267 (-) Transcript_10944:183-983(-)